VIERLQVHGKNGTAKSDAAVMVTPPDSDVFVIAREYNGYSTVHAHRANLVLEVFREKNRQENLKT
jgi:hypothetical protein